MRPAGPTGANLTSEAGAPAIEHAGLESYVREFEQAAEEAAGVVGGWTVRDVLAGGRPARLKFAGKAMLDAFGPAFEHLPPAPAPEQQIAIWDVESTGVAGPQFPLPPRVPNGAVHVQSERLRAIHGGPADTETTVDHVSGLAAYRAPSASALPGFERCAPLRIALISLLGSRRRHFVHSGAVSGAAGAVMVVGGAESGKSTLTAACARGGSGYLGDDYVVLSFEPAPTAWSLYCTVKLGPWSTERLGLRDAPSLPAEDGTNRRVFHLGREIGLKPVIRAPVAAIVAPRIIKGTRSLLRRITAGEAVRALAPSTVIQPPTQGRDALLAIAKLAKRVPCYSLEVGSDLDAATAAVRELADG
jgi:hypothetical protein